MTFESLSIYGYSLLPTVFLQCRLNPFIENVTRSLSTYLSVGIVIDRLIRSELPVRSRILCTRRNVLIMSAILLITFSAVGCLYFVLSSSRDVETGQCSHTLSISYSYYLVRVNASLRAVLLCVVPMVLMVGANVRMLQNIRQSQLRVGDAMKLAGKNKSNSKSMTTSSVIVSGPTCRRVSPTDRMLSYMILTSVSTFVVTQIPLHVYSVVEAYVTVFDDGIREMLVHSMVLIWSSIYFGIAFYLYCLASPLFRKKFIKLAKQMYLMVCPAKALKQPAMAFCETHPLS